MTLALGSRIIEMFLTITSEYRVKDNRDIFDINQLIQGLA
jgi:hypothetical protein